MKLKIVTFLLCSLVSTQVICKSIDLKSINMKASEEAQPARIVTDQAVLAVPQKASLHYQYDALGRLICVEDSKNGNRRYEYDEVGNRNYVSIDTCTN